MPSLALDVRVLSSTSGTPQCNGYYILSDLYFPQVYNRFLITITKDAFYWKNLFLGGAGDTA